MPASVEPEEHLASASREYLHIENSQRAVETAIARFGSPVPQERDKDEDDEESVEAWRYQ